jgi:hypothetical protein
MDRSDVKSNGLVAPAWLNRLIVEADSGGICCSASSAVDLVVDVNGVSNGGLTLFVSRWTDTRSATQIGVADLPTDAAGAPVWPASDSFTFSSAVTGTIPRSASVRRSSSWSARADLAVTRSRREWLRDPIESPLYRVGLDQSADGIGHCDLVILGFVAQHDVPPHRNRCPSQRDDHQTIELWSAERQ